MDDVQRWRDRTGVTNQDEYDHREAVARLEAAKRGAETNLFYAVLAEVERGRERLGGERVPANTVLDHDPAESLTIAADRLWESLPEEQRREVFHDGVRAIFRLAAEEDIVT